jgi:hypothetical protein
MNVRGQVSVLSGTRLSGRRPGIHRRLEADATYVGFFVSGSRFSGST